MWYMKEDPLSGQQTRTQKGVDLVLKERGLWPAHDLKLECPKPKCLECQEISDCKVCVKGSRCDSCKTPKVHSNSNCGNGRTCDACEEREKNDVNARGRYTVRDVQTKSRVNARTVRISLLNAPLIIVVQGVLSPFSPIF